MPRCQGPGSEVVALPTNQSTRQRFLRRLPRLLTLVNVLAVSALPISGLYAQKVQLRPVADVYLPSRISIRHGSLDARQKIGVTIGARLSLTLTQRFDVVTVVTYLPGYITLRGAGKRIDVGAGSHLLIGTTGARYWLLESARQLSWEVHTGLGVALGGQPAYEDLFQSSTVSGILGSTIRLQVGRIVSLQLGVQDRLYRVRFGDVAAGTRSRPLQLSFGLGLPFLRVSPPSWARAL
jgi:hypothetical protein